MSACRKQGRSHAGYLPVGCLHKSLSHNHSTSFGHFTLSFPAGGAAGTSVLPLLCDMAICGYIYSAWSCNQHWIINRDGRLVWS